MKKILSLGLLLGGFCMQSNAKDGYKIQLKFSDIKDSTYYLAHYFAKPLPTIYKSDSGKLDKTGFSILKSDKKITGGMYLIMMADRKTYFEFLLNNGDDLVINITDSKNLPSKGLSIKNSPDNEAFIGYETFVRNMGEEHQALAEKLSKAKNSVDSAAIKEQMSGKMKSLIDYRLNYSAKNSNSLLSKIFRGLELPKVPEGKHYLPNGKEDKDYSYQYYKAHYWDNFDLTDGRMINTPIYDARLVEYFEKLVIPSADSVIKEADWILSKTRGTGDLFNYTLSFLSNFSQESKIMGMDKAYVHLVDNYYAKGDATWLTPEMVQKHIDHGRELGPTIIGKVGYDITMKDTSGKKDITVSNIKAKYKLLVMWEPTCGHCMKEIPAIDSAFKAAKLKSKGLKIIGICSEDNPVMWKEFIQKHQLNDWTHMYDPEHKSNYKAWYNVRSFPTIYLLDEKGIIRGKTIDHSNIATLIDILEQQEADSKKSGSK